MDFNELFLQHITTGIDDLIGRPTESQLNENLCYYWAYVFSKVIGGHLCSFRMTREAKINTQFDKISEHAFVQLDNKFYDSRHLGGVDWAADLYPNDFDLSDYTVVEYSSDDAFLSDWGVQTECCFMKETVKRIKLAIRG